MTSYHGHTVGEVYRSLTHKPGILTFGATGKARSTIWCTASKHIEIGK
jgi:hypothetical protein